MPDIAQDIHPFQPSKYFLSPSPAAAISRFGVTYKENSWGYVMNWEAIGAAGELVGSVAVLITLVYLARQISHTREEVARSINNSRAETVRNL